MSTVKMSQLLSANEILGRLVKEQLPPKVSFRLSKMIKYIGQEVAFFQEFNNEKIRKYGEEDQEKPGMISVKPNTEKHQKYLTDITDVLNEDVDFPFDPIDVSSLDINMSTEELLLLEFMLTGLGEDEDKKVQDALDARRQAHKEKLTK